MGKVSQWLSLMASSAALFAAGCTSTTTGNGKSGSTALHWPWSSPVAATGAPVMASTSDPTSLASKPPKPGPDLYVATARIYEKTGDFNGAADQYQKALKVDPGNLPALLGYAQLEDGQRQFSEADKHYQEALQRHPKEAAVYNDRGRSFERRGRLEDAARMFAKAIELQPDKQLYRNNMATVLVTMRRNAEALAQLTAVHGPAVAHYNLAILLHRQGNDSEAEYHFAQAAQIDPSLLAAREWAERLAPSPRPAAQLAADDRVRGSRPPLENLQVASRRPIVSSDSNPGFSGGPAFGTVPVNPTLGAGPRLTMAQPPTESLGMRYPQHTPTVVAAEGAIPPSPDGINEFHASNDGLRPLPPVQ